MISSCTCLGGMLHQYPLVIHRSLLCSSFIGAVFCPRLSVSVRISSPVIAHERRPFQGAARGTPVPLCCCRNCPASPHPRSALLSPSCAWPRSLISVALCCFVLLSETVKEWRYSSLCLLEIGSLLQGSELAFGLRVDLRLERQGLKVRWRWTSRWPRWSVDARRFGGCFPQSPLPVPEAGSPGGATSLVLGFRSLRLRSVELSGN